MKQLFIIRGLPGSGKSTLAEQLAPPEHICCHDDHLYIDGKYVYTKPRHERAKLQSFAKFEGLLHAGVERIVFAGVAPNLADAKPYVRAAEAAGYRVIWLIVENRHGNKTIHDVPDETIEGMRRGFKIDL